MNRIGVGEACRIAKAYANLAGDGWTVPSFFADQGDQGWDFSYVDSTVNDGVATITINRPEAMNALNVTVVGQLTKAVAMANAIDRCSSDAARPTTAKMTPKPVPAIPKPTNIP